MRLSDFDFALPDSLIAHYPADPRDSARMLHIAPDLTGDRMVRDLPNLLRPGDVMVFNDSKVIPARLYGYKSGSETRFEFLLHKSLSADTWEAWAKPAKRLKIDDIVRIENDFCATVIDKTDAGPIHLRFDRGGADLMAALHQYGLPPLPPYIDRAAEAADVQTYQTIYARDDAEGSVAAPTAGLHFTDDLLHKIDAMGVIRAHVTLHVGAGTFKPVTVDNIAKHLMHAEFGEITQTTADLINKARAEGGRVITVGTTSTRLLETASSDDGFIKPHCNDTQIFITPGYRFKAVDRLMTNFHLPKSTLFMLVSAFAGLDRMQAAYAHAIAHQYRFYSYGDSCFLEPSASRI